VEASALEVRMAENQQTQRILLAVLEVQNAHAASVLTRGSYKESLERVAFAQKKVEAGDGTVLDLLRMQQDAESARANLVSSDEALRRSYERLGLALGVMDSVSLKTMNLDLNAMVHGACKRRGTGTERPDVEAAKKRLEAAQERLRSVRWALAPTLDVSGYLSQFVAGNESSLGVSVFGLLSVPIFDGGAIYGRRRAAEGQEAQALAQWETLRREATFSRQSAERDVESSERVREARQSGKVLALAAEEMARSTHASGWVTTFELITAAAQRRQAEREWLQAEFDTQRAKIVEWVSASTCTWE
jgi:outer membrane protein TolC